jgi:hypothetical protein
MNKNNSSIFEDAHKEINDFPLAVRFAARRAILNAQTITKVTTGKFEPKFFTCDLRRNSRLRKWFNSSAD